MVVALLLQCVAPAFSGEDERIRALHDSYLRAYQVYNDAIVNRTDVEATQKALDDYLKARRAYDEAIGAAKSETVPSTGSVSAGSGESGGADASTNTATGDPAPSVTPTTTDATTVSPVKENTAGSWFSKMFKKAKEALFGKAGEKKMPLLERIAWNVGRSLLPSFATVLVTALLAPLSPVAMIIGGIVMGAASSGLLTYAYEKRMNAKYRETPIEDAKLWRNVTVDMVTQGVMAPFNMATGGLFGMVGPTVGKAVTRVALTKAAIGFTGATLASVVGGGVKKLWSEHVFHYPEKIANNQARINEILGNHLMNDRPLTDAEVAELTRLRTEIDAMKAEDYSFQDFKRDMKRAAVGAAVSDFAGTLVSTHFYDYSGGRWADKLSVKMFDNVSKGRAISDLFTSLPVDYFSGMTRGLLNKSFVTEDIKELEQYQAAFQPGTPAHEYYENLIKVKEGQREDINIWKEGLNTMGNNVANRSAQLAVQALKYNLYDGPKARKAAIEAQYHAGDADWQKANASFEKYQSLEQNPPNRKDFRSVKAYDAACAQYKTDLAAAKRAWVADAARAQSLDDSPAKRQAQDAVAQNFDRMQKLNQLVELGRLQGGIAHVAAVKNLLKAQKPELAQLSDHDLTGLAVQTIKASSDAKYQQLDTRLKETDALFEKYADMKAGKLKLSPDEAKLLQGQHDLISPSQYRAMWVERKVYEMKAQGARWNDIQNQMPTIMKQAEAANLSRYDNSWNKLMVAEIYANGLARYKYDPQGQVNFTKQARDLVSKAPQLAQAEFVNDFNSRVNSAITQNIMPLASKTDTPIDDYLSSFATNAATSGSGMLLNTVLDSSRSTFMNALQRR